MLRRERMRSASACSGSSPAPSAHTGVEWVNALDAARATRPASTNEARLTAGFAHCLTRGAIGGEYLQAWLAGVAQ